MNRKYRRYGELLYRIIKFIEKTMTITQIFPENFNKDENFVLAFWHNKLVMTLLGTGFIKKKVGLASPTKDGELISVPLERYGAEMIRGSSDKESVKSLLRLIKKVKEGYTIGTPVDGPKGPIYEVKPGMLYIAQKSGKCLVPMGVAYEKAWVFKKSWDKFQLPKPFSKAVVVFGEPYIISLDADLQLEALVLKDKINEMDKKAKIELEKILRK
ncbi:MAG: lysophospholipid acyltransferase family protein [Fusobacteriaceae bacterium]